MHLGSTAFSDGSPIPSRFTCDGEDLSPPLKWNDPPAETRSFALLCDDPDAPGGTWHHWAAYDIPAALTSLAQGAAQHAEKQGFKQATNDFQRSGYGGPCPPHRHGLHPLSFPVACALDRPSGDRQAPVLSRHRARSTKTFSR
jgi:Raf kinase inhibitor-like YbhB/YbcL family protein